MRKIPRKPRTARLGRTGPIRPGFTLVELLVVIVVIGMLMVLVLPSVSGLFRTGAQTQARNMVDASIRSARSMAVQRRRYMALHFQRGLDGSYWLAPLEEQDGTSAGARAFDMAEGGEATKLPGSMGGGEVSERFVAGDGSFQLISDKDDFMSFTVLFDPNGRLISQVDRKNVELNSCTSLFTTRTDLSPNSSQIWSKAAAQAEKGVRALCLFDMAEFDLCADDKARQNYLAVSARFLPINPYVGGLVRSKHE